MVGLGCSLQGLSLARDGGAMALRSQFLSADISNVQEPGSLLPGHSLAFLSERKESESELESGGGVGIQRTDTHTHIPCSLASHVDGLGKTEVCFEPHLSACTSQTHLRLRLR
jgi:hypothetical protein